MYAAGPRMTSIRIMSGLAIVGGTVTFDATADAVSIDKGENLVRSEASSVRESHKWGARLYRRSVASSERVPCLRPANPEDGQSCRRR